MPFFQLSFRFQTLSVCVKSECLHIAVFCPEFIIIICKRISPTLAYRGINRSRTYKKIFSPNFLLFLTVLWVMNSERALPGRLSLIHVASTGQLRNWLGTRELSSYLKSSKMVSHLHAWFLGVPWLVPFSLLTASHPPGLLHVDLVISGNCMMISGNVHFSRGDWLLRSQIQNLPDQSKATPEVAQDHSHHILLFKAVRGP